MRSRLRDEGGAVAILAALLLVVLFGAVAFAIDLSRLYHQRQVLQNAVDFGALAGAHDLPVQDAAEADVAKQSALQLALDNAPGLSAAAVNISFRCIVSDPASDVPFVCGPASGLPWSSGWTSTRTRMSHECDPYAGDTCNTIVVSTVGNTKYYFAPVLGIDQGSTGSVQAAACRGTCGPASSPLDVAMVIDRSRSMSAFDLANVKNAALAVLDFYDSKEQHVGLVGLPYHDPADPCRVKNPQTYPNVGTAWDLVPLSSDYKRADGTLNSSSNLVRTINCLQRAPANLRTTPSGAGHTDLGDPLQAAAAMVVTQGRPDVPDVVIFMTDGEANQPRLNQPCAYTATRGASAKAAGAEIFTIAYGVASARCTQDTSGAYRNGFATRLLADIATASDDDFPGGCGPDENTDGDHYFCESGSADLEPVFRQVAAAAIGNSRLIV